ncbi:MAG: family 78 glycoside hydrolase catalytic domain [Ferruginibacter sp.]|nr:family 78 glycoside hydrolase catalytic domain [Ferruginibacter sp.]
MKKAIALLLIQLFAIACFSQVLVKEVLCENTTNPIGMDISRPQLSWQLQSATRNTMQTAYEIRVAENSSDLAKGKNLSWNTGKVVTDKSVHIIYEGTALKSTKKYYWQVRVWDNHGKTSAWTKPAFWQMGLLKKEDWKAKWIQAAFPEDILLRPSPLFRKTFTAYKKIQSASLYITSHGLYESFINGQRIGEAYLTPGFTSFNKRLQYQVYDVTKNLQQGKNAIGVSLGNGWYRGNLVWEGKKNIYGNDVSVLYQLKIIYTDGTSDDIISDDTWKSSTGAVRSSEIYHGETIDSRMEKDRWNTTAYVDGTWSGVKTVSFDNVNLVATINEPVTKHEIFKPIKIFKTPLGEQVIDFGQNLVGFVQVKVKGNAGDKIIIHHAEVLDKEGNFYTANLRAARQTNIYILKGAGEEIFEPHFTFQGFRYIKVEGFPAEIKPENFTAIALYSDMKPTGSFTTSNVLLNQLQHNIQWGQKGNFLDIPTDCPQRDERLGWTGDAQVFSRTASYNMDVNNFFRKWMKDVAADQLPNGSVPFVVPNVLGDDAAGSTGWADVATIIPWNMYLAYGDKRILEEQYASMKAWVGFMESKSKNDLWNTGFHFGDWLFYRPDDDNDGRAAITDKYMIAQCFYAHSTQLLINAASVLNKKEDVQKYTALLQKIKTAFVKEYVTGSGRLVSSSQTAYVLALHFDMLPENLRPAAAERLVANIKDYNYHLTTGFLGTPYLCRVLSRFGYHDVAYTLLMQETYPSWLYPVKMGATTIWERWDGQKPDSSFQSVGMNSFNHYAYGAIGDWMYRVVAGIDTDDSEDGVGYKKIIIRPHVDGAIIKAGQNSTEWSKMSGLEKNKDSVGGLKNVSAELLTDYGKVSSHWINESGQLSMEVEIPVNTSAVIYLPIGKTQIIKEGGAFISNNKSIIIKERQSDYTILEVGSGKYFFTLH